ncbi:MAG TPA: ABC transporter permease [Candidatus Acidoferrum sp.]|nr:ABC transporter permease [Candidatus Acidoferrum sp.]
MRFWRWFSRRSQEADELDEELRFHIAEEAKLRMERGQPSDSAWREARRDFGNFELAREVTRAMWGWSALERAAQDLRFGVRMLRKNPAFTALTLAALALGIGATTAIFSVVNSVLLKPLPFPNPARLVMVWERPPQSQHNNVVQTQNFLDWRKRNRSFENIAAMFQLPLNLEGASEPVQVPGLLVTAGFFEILGVQPQSGRTIRSEDDVVGAPGVVVLTHGLWQRRFGGRPDVVGQKIVVNNRPRDVIGILPPGFEFPPFPQVDLYMPMAINPADAPRDGRNYKTVARLKPNVTIHSAQADMEAIAAQTAAERPNMNAKWSAAVVALMEQTVGESRTALWVLLGAVTFVLLIACANVSNLLLMRASARKREIAVRVALGAGRWRLLHQLISESLLLAVAGGLLGFLLAYWGVPAILKMLPAGFPLPRMAEIGVEDRVLAFTMLVSLGCGVFFGVLPALQVNRSHVGQGLRRGGRHGSAGSRRMRGVLVVAEVSLAMLLVIGAGLMVRSLILLNAVDPGFRPERVMTFRMMLLPTQFSSYDELLARRAAMVEQMLQRIRALPMVSAASSISFLPMSGSQSGSGYYRADRPAPAPGTPSGGDVSTISDGYFRAMGIQVLAGREFDVHDHIGAPPVAVINHTAARLTFPGEDPIGKRLKIFWGRADQVEIVGVTADIHHAGLDAKPDPCVFLSHAQFPSSWTSLVVRTSGAPLSAVAVVKEQIHAVAPHQGVEDIRTMEDVMSRSIARPKLEAALLTIFGLVALVLACVGIYAVISYSVEQRMREMGIRLALGAAPRSILRLVMREGVALTASGIGIGLLAAVALTRYLETLLFEIRPTDAPVYATVSAVLVAAALAGCYFPARRATRVDPAVVLREE